MGTPPSSAPKSNDEDVTEKDLFGSDCESLGSKNSNEDEEGEDSEEDADANWKHARYS